MLNTISAYNLPVDYIKNEEEIVRNMTIEQHKQLAEKYLTELKRIWITTVMNGPHGTQLDADPAKAGNKYPGNSLKHVAPNVQPQQNGSIAI